MLDRAFVSEQQLSSDLAIPGREIVFVQRMLVAGRIAFGRWGSMYFL